MKRKLSGSSDVTRITRKKYKILKQSYNTCKTTAQGNDLFGDDKAFDQALMSLSLPHLKQRERQAVKMIPPTKNLMIPLNAQCTPSDIDTVKGEHHFEDGSLSRTTVKIPSESGFTDKQLSNATGYQQLFISKPTSTVGT